MFDVDCMPELGLPASILSSRGGMTLTLGGGMDIVGQSGFAVRSSD
jgi:hypothetical protein